MATSAGERGVIRVRISPRSVSAIRVRILVLTIRVLSAETLQAGMLKEEPGRAGGYSAGPNISPNLHSAGELIGESRADIVLAA